MRTINWFAECIEQIDYGLANRIKSMIASNDGLKLQGKPYHDLEAQIKLIRKEYLIDLNNTSIFEESQRASQRHEAQHQLVGTHQKSLFYQGYKAEQLNYERVAEIVDGRMKGLQRDIILTVTQELQESLSAMIKSLVPQSQFNSTVPRTSDVASEQPSKLAKTATKSKETSSPSKSNPD